MSEDGMERGRGGDGSGSQGPGTEGPSATSVVGSARRLVRALRSRLPAGARTIEGGPATGLRIGRREASADYAKGTNELPVQVALADALAPGGVFLDVGANVGFFSLMAARLVGPTGSVYAIEPVPANVRAIQANVRRNGFRNVSAIEAAATARTGSTTLNLAVHPGGAVLESAGAPPDPEGAIDVRTVAIDDLVAGGGMRAPTVVKIDVEGAEVEAIEGMVSTLRDHRPVVVCEVDGRDEDSLARNGSAITSLLEGAGYEVEVLERSYSASDWRVDHLLARPVGEHR